MRLYLSSFKIGNQPQNLVELVGLNKNTVVVLNARDHKQECRNEYLLGETEARNDFGKEKALEKFLRTKGLVWIDGGNTFLLRRAMKQSGFNNVITKLLKGDSIVYGGFSAAVVVLQKSLHGLDIVDNPNNISDGYNSEIIWDGLGILDYNVSVHYKSDHPESALVDKEVQYNKDNNIPYK